MKTMMSCFTTGNICTKVRDDWKQLASIMYKLPVDPNPTQETEGMQDELLKKITVVCYECHTKQLIKRARADVKAADKVLSEATKDLKAEEAKSLGIMFAIYKRLVAAEPELEEVFDTNTYLLDCIIERDAEWIAHGELLDGLEEAVDEAKLVAVKAKLVLDDFCLLNKTD